MAANVSTVPTLCVVGHPNKGKSSIVSTLAEDDSVRVGVESGTTQEAGYFDFEVQGEVALTLVDTPGFQRARQVLGWLQAESVSPADRPGRVAAFLAEPEHRSRFPDEVALLQPIMDGAGILFVVDAAHPVTVADEAEMEILRWTGQPRMAVINPIDASAATDQWERALSQFFQWVRVFNPMTAVMPARQALLRAVGELTPAWHRPIEHLCRQLEVRESDRLAAISREIAAYWCEQMVQRVGVTVLDDSGLLSAERRLHDRLDAGELAFFQQLQSQFGHTRADVVRAEGWDLDSQNLMQTETWYLWGLKQRDLIVATGGTGAAAGLAVDAGLGGASLFLGALSGGVVGSVGGWWASRRLPGKSLGWLPLTREKRFAGPVTHPNFPLVVMARALTFTQHLWLRPHARRDVINLQTQASQWTRQAQRDLIQWAEALQKPMTGRNQMAWKKKWTPEAQKALIEWVQQTLDQQLQVAYEQQRTKVWDSE